MAIRYTCPHCGVQMNVDPAYAGQTGPCSKCGEKITIPEAKLADLPPVGAYGAPSSGGGSSGCVVASLVTVVALMMAVVCGGGFLFAVARPARVAAQTSQSNNNLRQIGLALMTYHDAYGSFPPAYVADASGKKLYSWRVLVLPFLEQAALYEAFDKSKAWDSPENAALSQQIISVFRSPADSGELCSYFAITGKGTAFEGDKSIRMSDVTDGTSNTIWVVEARHLGRSWAEPFDIDLDASASVIGYGPGQLPGPGGDQILHALQMDGATTMMPPPSEAEFRAMTSIRGGEVRNGTGAAAPMVVPAELAPPVAPAAPIAPDRPPVVDGNDTAPINRESSEEPKAE